MKAFDYDPTDVQARIIYRDDSIVVANKPPGLLSVPGRLPALGDCLLTRLLAEFSDLLLVHRLDMDTSGAMVFARTKAAQRDLSMQFEKRVVRKTYLARVHGRVTGYSGAIDLPLAADWPNRPLQKICEERGKDSLTKWRIIRRSAPSSLVMLQPKTGRSHQLRVHMQAIGHPVLGDRFYGLADGKNRLMLHAWRLRFRHPVNHCLVGFTARDYFGFT